MLLHDLGHVPWLDSQLLYHAQARGMLQQAGLAPERLALVNLGVGHGQAFADAVSALADSIKEAV